MTVRRIRWIKASLLTIIAAAPPVAAFTLSALAIDDTAAAADSGPAAQSLVDAINGDISSKRQDAADQLVNRSDTVAAVKQILRNPDNPPGQVAVAKALAKQIAPNPVFISDLANLLGSNTELTEPAAEALASMSYDDHPDAFVALRNFIDTPSNPQSARVSAISALSQIVQQSVAGYLVQLTTAANQSPAIINATTAALSDLTGITSYGSNPQQWSAWWNGVKSLNTAEFRSRVLQTRDVQFKLYKQRGAQFLKDATVHLEQNYASFLNLDKELAQQTLLGYLSDPLAEIRYVGVDLIDQFWQKPTVYSGPVRTQMLSMINDPDARVRLRVINVLLDVNDHDADELLIARLKAESDVAICVQIIQVLGKLDDPKATPALLAQLHSPQPELVVAAANAIAALADKLRDGDPDEAARAADQLRKIVDPNAAVPARDDVRAACVGALAALHDRLSLKLFLQLIAPAERSSQVRQAALSGLGNLGDTVANDQVYAQLDDNDREVRAAAATALQTIATPDQADLIFRKMKSDPYPKVCDALWVALQNLYSQEKPDDLNRWANELAHDPQKQLITLQKLGDAYAAAKDTDGVAQNQQAIADAMMQVDPPRPLDAIHNLQSALAYWRGSGKGDPDKLESIVDSLLADQLYAGLWSDATSFAADQIRIDPVYQATVGPRIKNKADELSSKDSDYTNANALIDAALKMDPPLEPKYRDQLLQIREAMKNKPPTPPGN